MATDKKTKLEILSQLKESFNKSIDKKIECEKLNESVKGLKEQPISVLVNVFESISDKLVSGKKGQKCIKKYVNVIKENADLKKAYIADNIARYPKDINDSKLFTDTFVRMLQEIDSKSLKDGREKLSEVVSESVIVSKITSEELNNIINESKTSINEAFDYLVENKCVPTNMVEWCNKVATITDYVNANNVMTEECEVDNPQKLLEELSDMVGDGSTDTSKVMIDLSECILKGESPEVLFETYRNECISAIDEAMEDVSVEEKARLESMKMGLNEKKYREDTLSEDLLKMRELKQVISES